MKTPAGTDSASVIVMFGMDEAARLPQGEGAANAAPAIKTAISTIILVLPSGRKLSQVALPSPLMQKFCGIICSVKETIYSMPPAAALLARVRKICEKLPGVTETVTFGHPTFQAKGKTFAVFEQYKGELGLALKVEKELQEIFLKDARFFRTPYVGKHGWVTLRMTGNIQWREVHGLLRGSYSLVANKQSRKTAG